MSRGAVRHVAISWDEIAGWREDDARAALLALLDVPAVLHGRPTRPAALAALDRGAVEDMGSQQARLVFESHYTPHRLEHDGGRGLLTGYYEPVLEGRRERSTDFTVPIHRRPPELVTLIAEHLRAGADGSLTHAAAIADGVVPFATRAAIEAGALAGRGLELMYFADPVDVFFLQVQGSGLVRLADGSMTRIGYDGKNGHPYSSIGRLLIEAGEIEADEMSLEVLGRWLRADRDRGRRWMQRNASYVFFRELSGSAAGAPCGVDGIPLTAGRSLAVDAAFNPIGTPVWVEAPTLDVDGRDSESRGLRRLLIAQDVGSAIRGPERGDLFYGTGASAGRWAGSTKHQCRFVVLLADARASSEPQPDLAP